MADLVDSSTAWETGIYQIETTDPVVGGVPNPATGAGMSNIPHLQLARRTNFLRNQLHGFADVVSYTVNGAIPAANIGRRGAWTPATAGALTLPAASAVPIGASFYLAAVGAAVTVTPNGADTITATNGATLASLSMAQGDDVLITRTGTTTWSLTGGSVALSTSGVLAGGNYRDAIVIGAGLTLTAADAGKCYVYGGTTPITITLPSFAAAGIGGVFEFVNTGTADVTVQRAGSDNIDIGPTTVTAVVVSPNQSLRLVRPSATTQWHLVFQSTIAGNYRDAASIGAGFTLTVADTGKCYVYGGTTAITITLPDITTIQFGGTFEFINTGTADVTVQRGGTDQIDSGPTSVTSIVIPPNQSLRIVRASGSSLWHPVGLTAAALAQPLAASIGANGWQRLPSGLIIQWGTAAVTSAGVAVTFPIAFPTAVRAVVATSENTNNPYPGVYSKSVSGFTGQLSGSGQSATIGWIAIGN